jgi:hypothetical protein
MYPRGVLQGNGSVYIPLIASYTEKAARANVVITHIFGEHN